MKKFLILGLALLLAVPDADARRRAKRAGEIEDNVYTDSEYGFTMSIHENWKPKAGKEDDKVRLVLVQRNYDIPVDYLDAPDYTQLPVLKVYVDTTSMGEHAFIDSLTNPEFESDQKNDIKDEFEILWEYDIIPKMRSRVEIDGESGVLWRAQANYMKEVVTSAGGTSGKRVRRSYGGAIGAVKMDDTHIMLFHIKTEYEFFETIMAEVMSMIESVKFPDSDEE